VAIGAVAALHPVIDQLIVNNVIGEPGAGNCSCWKKPFRLTAIIIDGYVLLGETLQVTTDLEGPHLLSQFFPVLENGTFDLGQAGVSTLTDGALIRWPVNGTHDLIQHDAPGWPHQ